MLIGAIVYSVILISIAYRLSVYVKSVISEYL